MKQHVCYNCAFRTLRQLNQWNEQPAFGCMNPESFRYQRKVLKGMTCNKFEKEGEAA